jgi:hypothetical protein
MLKLKCFVDFGNLGPPDLRNPRLVGFVRDQTEIREPNVIYCVPSCHLRPVGLCDGPGKLDLRLGCIPSFDGGIRDDGTTLVHGNLQGQGGVGAIKRLLDDQGDRVTR